MSKSCWFVVSKRDTVYIFLLAIQSTNCMIERVLANWCLKRYLENVVARVQIIVINATDTARYVSNPVVVQI